MTIIAQQKDGLLIPYVTTRKHELVLLRYGSLNIKQMFDAEHSDAKLQTWKLRAAGLFVLYASSVCLARLLRILCKYLCSSKFIMKQLNLKRRIE